MKDEVLNAVRKMGYSVMRGSREIGSHDVIVYRQSNTDYLIGVNPELPQPVRDALWAHHGRKIVGGLEKLGFKIDYEKYATRRYWRAFAL